MRPLRTALALALSALAFGATVAAAGWLAPATGLPGSLTVPDQRVGDNGEYELTLLETDGSVDHYVALRFAWRPTIDLRVADGTVRTANQLDVETTVRVPDGSLVQRSATYYWDAADPDAQLGARTAEVAVDEVPVVGLSVLATPVAVDVSRLSLHVPGTHGGAVEPCGPLTKSGRIDLSERQELTWACHTGLRVLAAQTFEAVGRQDLDGVPTVVFAERHPSCCAHVWLSPEVPYLVQASDRAEDGRQAILRLVRFERGTGPVLAKQNQADPDALSDRDDEGTRRWGPDDSGRGPFPLAAAFARARDDPAAPALADWLAAHPHAYMAEANGRTTTRGGADAVTWRFVVADGEGAMAVGITRTAPFAGGSPFGLAFSTGATYNYENLTLPKDVHYPAFHDVRPSSPTVGWLIGRWHAFGGEGPATSWGFSHSCRDDEACTFVHARTWVGVAHYDLQGATLPTGDAAGMGPSSADVRYLEETSARLRADTGSQGSAPNVALVDLQRSAGLPSPTVTLLQPATAASPPAAEGGWNPPSTTAWAAAGGIALAALLAVRFGPVLAAPLFSRIQGPDLLEHPVRRMVHQAVEANPGIHLKALARTVGRPRNTVEHHVRKLVAGGLVTQHDLNGYACLFAKGQVDRRAQAAAGALKSEAARKVLAAVVTTPGASGRDVAAAAGLTPTLVSYHVHNLQQAGLVEGQRQGRQLRLLPTELGRQAAA
jgi:biotin operon repressor